MNLSQRGMHPELMDQSALPTEALEAALIGLRRVHAASFTAKFISSEILRMNRGHPSVTILDVGCGDGTVLQNVVRLVQQKGIVCKGTGCDVNERTIAIAKNNNTLSSVQFVAGDARNVLDNSPFDFVMTSLFLHHLDEDQLRNFIQCLRDSVNKGFVMCDLLRSRWSLFLATYIPPLLTKSHVVRSDAVTSVFNAFTLDELRSAFGTIEGVRIGKLYPCHCLISYERQS